MPAATVLDASTQTEEASSAGAGGAAGATAEPGDSATGEGGDGAGGANQLPISLSKEPRERKKVVRFVPSLLNLEGGPSPELLEASVGLCVADAAMQAMACAEGAHDYVQSTGATWSLVAQKSDAAKREFKMVTLNGPQGEYQLAEPRNTKEARLMPDSDLWFNEEVMHVSELEGGGILRAVERHEAEGHKIYPSQFEYTLCRRTQRAGASRSAKYAGA